MAPNIGIAAGHALMTTPASHHAVLAVVVPVAAALICAGLIVVLRPLLQRYALARPNARSSHVTPTPQGGGIAVMIATAIAAALAGLLGAPYPDNAIAIVMAAAFCLAAVGMVDDLRPIPVLPAPCAATRCSAASVHRAAIAASNYRGAPAGAGANAAGSGDALVHQPREFHGRPRLDDGRGNAADHRRAGGIFSCRRSAGRDSADCTGACRRAARLCALQPARRPVIPGRRRQPADRPLDRLVPDRTGIAPASRRRPAAAALLSRRHHHHLVQADCRRRAVLGRPSIAFLSAGNRQRI